MDILYSAGRKRRPRTSRRRRTGASIRLEVLEPRTLLSLTLLQDINPVALDPTQITGAGGNVYFVTGAAGGGSDLDVKTATGTTILKEFPASNSSISYLTPLDSKLFFFTDSSQSEQLWVTNGTRGGDPARHESAHRWRDRSDGRRQQVLFHIRGHPWQ